MGKLLSVKEKCPCGLHCDGSEICYSGDLPQAENFTVQIFSCGIGRLKGIFLIFTGILHKNVF